MFEYKLHIDEFLNYCRYHKKLSDKTIRAYKIDLSQYGVFSNELSKQALWDYIEYLNKKYKPKTAKRKLATLKAFIHFLLLQDRISRLCLLKAIIRFAVQFVIQQFSNCFSLQELEWRRFVLCVQIMLIC